ncbi:hypothetical protein [Pseudomonas sp. NBRC 100443]|uniref:hypothetical protein n=1 Tax=Pseudomonas sp. NBRC 100443 TaxID=1113665 RepID=UPI0024A5DA30|nr:hypothetical protein [Pseudomonas sp. NBRC 100443]GLU38847.1 hypothetical protein Pssp01_29400 [Pseudomonas sp. NBRC 100443]
MTEIITSISAAALPARGQPLAGGTFIERYWLNNQERALVLLGPEFEREGIWGEYGQDVLTHYVDGEANTRAMAEAGSELAKKVLELGAHIAAPLEGQLLMAAKHSGLITDLREDRLYWLSAQRSALIAYYMAFEDGWQNDSGKYAELLVRPVRSLPILQ